MGAAVLAVLLAVLAVALVLGRGDGDETRTGTGGRAPTLATAPPTATTPEPGGPRLGLAIGMGTLFIDPTFGPAERERFLALAERDGVTEARVDALWELVEPKPPAGGRHTFDWHYPDSVAEGLARHGIRWWVVLDYAPGWAGADPRTLHSPPRDPADFARFGAAVAHRYGPGGTFWRAHRDIEALPVRTYEVWNEPNVSVFWPPGPDPAAYAELLDAAQGVLHAVQPKARVVSAGVAPFERYLDRMLARRPSLRRTIDAFGFHPYGRTPAAVAAKVRTARRQLDAAGMRSVPLALTEVGWVLAPGADVLAVREPTRARFLAETVRRMAHRGCGVEDVAYYTWVSSEQAIPKRDDWFGIARRPGTPTASTRAWAQLEHDPPPIVPGAC